jgi:hypothetical protein
MKTAIIWSRIFVIVGLAGMLLGAVDPLEGSFIILPGVGFVALGALLGQSRHRVLLYWSFTLVTIGVAAMVMLSHIGGIGGNTGRSMWWAVIVLPYPVGWLLGLAGGILAIVEYFKHHTAPTRA